MQITAMPAEKGCTTESGQWTWREISTEGGRVKGNESALGEVLSLKS